MKNGVLLSAYCLIVSAGFVQASEKSIFNVPKETLAPTLEQTIYAQNIIARFREAGRTQEITDFKRWCAAQQNNYDLDKEGNLSSAESDEMMAGLHAAFDRAQS